MPGREFARVFILLIGSLFTLGTFTGCGGYRFEGRVLSGSFPSVSFVDAGDERLNGAGIPGATVELIRDPDSLSAESVGYATADGKGDFSLPIDAFGAGWLDEEWLIRVRHPRANMIEQKIRLPGGGKKAAITLTPGRDMFTPKEDLMKEADRYR